MKLAALSALVFLLLLLLLACKSDPETTLTSADVCARDSDCAVTSFGDDCCDHCGQRAMTKKSLEELHARCKGKHVICPPIDCPFQPATAKCVSNQCVAVHP
jgi:hypothetical protein